MRRRRTGALFSFVRGWILLGRTLGFGRRHLIPAVHLYAAVVHRRLPESTQPRRTLTGRPPLRIVTHTRDNPSRQHSVNAQGLSQADAAAAADAAAGSALGATGGLHALQDGRIVVLPAKIQPNAPVLVVDADGIVKAGNADFGLDGANIVVDTVRTR
ncbi:MAG TPA: hypothetical protein VEQ63_00165 [Bryobacteraceae bacterium]|nr:hypothetical protein [Bryobacteraceae bacterium]